MNVLIAEEMSGRVRAEFHKRGHFAVSCDLLPSIEPWHGFNPWHYQGDIFDILERRCPPFYARLNERKWDLMIAFPPCTHLCVSGARWFKDKRREQREAIAFFMRMINSDIPRIAVENPIGIMSTQYRKPDQIIQPWQFGHGETKATCLWLKNLPKLVPTNVVEGREARIHKLPPSKDRAVLRSLTYPGIASAMAEQWGVL